VLIIFWLISLWIAEEMNVDEKKKWQRQQYHQYPLIKVDYTPKTAPARAY
jgi:hypothetical protein